MKFSVAIFVVSVAVTVNANSLFPGIFSQAGVNPIADTVSNSILKPIQNAVSGLVPAAAQANAASSNIVPDSNPLPAILNAAQNPLNGVVPDSSAVLQPSAPQTNAASPDSNPLSFLGDMPNEFAENIQKSLSAFNNLFALPAQAAPIASIAQAVQAAPVASLAQAVNNTA